MPAASYNRHSGSNSFNWTFMMPMAVAGGAYLYQKRDDEPALAVATADRIRGNYENKIRFFSPPEKIFEIFATIQGENGALQMSYVDFLRTLTPYNYGDMKSKDEIQKYLDHHGAAIKKVMHIADADGDGSVDFTEFLFFVTIHQMPVSIFASAFFDKYPNKKMNQEQFSKELNIHRKSTKLGQKLSESKLALDARNIKIKEADFVATCDRVTKRMFAGKEHIEYKDVLQLRHQMSQALWHFEYHQYFEEMENKENK